MTGRIGYDIDDPALALCGCGSTTLQCEVAMEHDRRFCCNVCDHIHTLHTLKLYGLLTR